MRRLLILAALAWPTWAGATVTIEADLATDTSVPGWAIECSGPANRLNFCGASNAEEGRGASVLLSTFRRPDRSWLPLRATVLIGDDNAAAYAINEAEGVVWRPRDDLEVARLMAGLAQARTVRAIAANGTELEVPVARFGEAMAQLEALAARFGYGPTTPIALQPETRALAFVRRLLRENAAVPASVEFSYAEAFARPPATWTVCVALSAVNRMGVRTRPERAIFQLVERAEVNNGVTHDVLDAQDDATGPTAQFEALWLRRCRDE